MMDNCSRAILKEENLNYSHLHRGGSLGLGREEHVASVALHRIPQAHRDTYHQGIVVDPGTACCKAVVAHIHCYLHIHNEDQKNLEVGAAVSLQNQVHSLGEEGHKTYLVQMVPEHRCKVDS